jgi:hypothetical protein
MADTQSISIDVHSLGIYIENLNQCERDYGKSLVGFPEVYIGR